MKKLNDLHNNPRLLENDLSQDDSVCKYNEKNINYKYCLLTKSHNTSGGLSNNYIYEIETDKIIQLLNIKEINSFLKKYDYL